jgi:serine/threonine protein phosphatase PrpC
MSRNRTATRLAFFGISDRGLKRSNNEDHFLVADLTRKILGVQDNRVLPDLIHHQIGPRGTLLAVADGLGGYERGEIASQLALEATVQALFSSAEANISLAHQLRMAVEAAHRAICQQHMETAPGSRMGSTLTAVHIGREMMTIAQVGDSRAYLFSEGKLILLTDDQTIVHMLHKKGLLTDEEAHNHPDRHVVLQALGQGDSVDPAIQSLPCKAGDCLLLCTDGLSSYVPHEQIEEILNTEHQENVRCQRLIQAANAAGGADNATVLLARLLW